ncbi:hypothetical protein JCM31598_43560 [Desulfonatronum parangueonense]
MARLAIYSALLIARHEVARLVSFFGIACLTVSGCVSLNPRLALGLIQRDTNLLPFRTGIQRIKSLHVVSGTESRH